jgi:inhibitor of KinA sporulation pathway (predicted exonuclease)
MDEALRMLKLSLVGTHHRGIDDARNIARIFKAEWAGAGK